MSKDKFKQFLEGIRTDENKNLMETIIGGYVHLFEADKEGIDNEEEETTNEEETVPEEVSEDSDIIPEEDTEEDTEEVSAVTEETPEVVPEEPKETHTNQVLIDGLNGDLSREYSAAIQYIQHAAVMTGAQYMKIAEEMLVHADEEIGHAKEISDTINYLGGVPTVEVAPIKTSLDPRVMIAQNKASEEEAIQRYKERIKQAEEAGESGTKIMLMEILADEEEHRNDLLVALGE